MGNWKSWIWPGLVVAACLTALAMWFRVGAIEADLRSRALAALGPTHGWVRLAVKGRDLTLAGLAPDETSRAEASEIATSVFGVRVVNDASGLLPEQSPYRLSARKTENGVILGGYVPNEAQRSQVVAALSAMLPGIAVTDEMKLARGAPEQLTGLAGYALATFSRFSTGSMDITDTVVSIRGTALDPDDHEAVLSALSAPPPAGGVLGSVEITPAAIAEDYGWMAEIDGDEIRLSGYAPGEGVRTGISGAAKAARPDLAVDDQMRLASGGPEGVDWLDATTEAISVLSHLAQGRATIRGKLLDLSGQATDADAFRKLQQVLDRGLSSGLVLGTADIGVAAAPGFSWSAALSGQRLVVDGTLPREATRARLVEIAEMKFGAVTIDDRQKIGAGAPEGFEAAVSAALQALSRLTNAEATLRGRKLSLRGSALNQTAQREIARTLADEIPLGIEVDAEIETLPMPAPTLGPTACQDELDRLAEMNSVLFETAEARIQPHSYGFLDRIAFTAQRCGKVRLEIAGHTDLDGAAAENQDLSERRARSVADFLVSAGVAADRLTAIGYSEERPLADTEAGKAVNRRIEFRVVP